MPFSKNDTSNFFDLLSDFSIGDLKTCLPEVAGWIGDNLDPDQVFDKDRLEAWALDNGYAPQE